VVQRGCQGENTSDKIRKNDFIVFMKELQKE
jgi:hypothetical protein